jgi:hypothetical protein
MSQWFTIFDRSTGVILRRVYTRPEMIDAQYDPANHDHIEGNFADDAFAIDPATREPVF